MPGIDCHQAARECTRELLTITFQSSNWKLAGSAGHHTSATTSVGRAGVNCIIHEAIERAGNSARGACGEGVIDHPMCLPPALCAAQHHQPYVVAGARRVSNQTLA